jgi:hypothetical protein
VIVELGGTLCTGAFLLCVFDLFTETIHNSQGHAGYEQCISHFLPSFPDLNSF